MSFKAELRASMGWSWSEGSVTDSSRLAYARQMLDGNDVNQAEAAWFLEEQELLIGAATTYDLTALGRSILGAATITTLMRVKALLVINHTTDGGQLLLGNAASDEWFEPFGAAGDQVVVPADSVLLLSNRQQGWVVDAGSRNLKLTASGGDATYSIAVVGTTSAESSSSGV